MCVDRFFLQDAESAKIVVSNQTIPVLAGLFYK